MIRWRRPTQKPRDAGFTLLELIVVTALISLLLAVVFPRVDGPPRLSEEKQLIRWLTRQIRALKTLSFQEQRVYVLRVDFTTNGFWIEPGGDDPQAFPATNQAHTYVRLSDQLQLMDVVFFKGPHITTADAQIRFYPQGHSDRAIVRIRQPNAPGMSVLIEPFLPEPAIQSGYADYGVS